MWSRSRPPDVLLPSQAVSLLDKYARAACDLSGNVSHVDNGEYFENNMIIHPMDPGHVFQTRQRGIIVRCFQMDHSVPSLAYGVASVKQKLKPEYQGLPGAEIAKMRKAGIQVVGDVETPLFVFCGDTTAKCFSSSPGLLDYPVIIIECSFLLEEDRAKAESSKHMMWSDLEPIVLANPHIRFLLIHFSMRYSRQEICDFFALKRQAGCCNVEIMLQEEGDYFGSTFGLPLK